MRWPHPTWRRRAWLAGLLAFQAVWIGWGLTSVLHRAHDAAVAAPDPRRWRFWTPDVADLRSLLDEVVPTLPLDAIVRVDEGTAPADPAEVWHWCQYLAPETAFVRGVDGGDAGRAGFRLRWRIAAGDRRWRPIAVRGAFAFEARRTEEAP